MAVARKHGLYVIEDACQAHGAEYKGKKVGSFGDVGTFSLNNFKNLCGGEGGLFTTDDEDYLNKGVLIRCFGDEIDEVSRRRVYNASILGYMYRNQELPAALCRAQLLHLDEYNAVRIANAEYMSRELSRIPGVIPPYCPPECKHVYFMYNVRFDPAAAGVDCDRRTFRIAVEKALYKEGMLVGQWQTMPVPAQDLFQSMLGYGGSRHPWAINEAKGIRYNYDPTSSLWPRCSATPTRSSTACMPQRQTAHGQDPDRLSQGLLEPGRGDRPRRRSDLPRRRRQALRRRMIDWR